MICDHRHHRTQPSTMIKCTESTRNLNLHFHNHLRSWHLQWEYSVHCCHRWEDLHCLPRSVNDIDTAFNLDFKSSSFGCMTLPLTSFIVTVTTTFLKYHHWQFVASSSLYNLCHLTFNALWRVRPREIIDETKFQTFWGREFNSSTVKITRFSDTLALDIKELWRLTWQESLPAWPPAQSWPAATAPMAAEHWVLLITGTDTSSSLDEEAPPKLVVPQP